MFLELKNTDIGYTEPLISKANASLNLGEVCLLVGNNGTGKTTLIKSILHQIPIISGEILIHQKNVRNLSPKDIAKLVSVVFSKAEIPQNYTLEDLISLGKYIHYPYYFELSDQDKKEVENIISDLHLEKYKHLNLSQLSDGNLQKAFIGRAFLQNSPFIILDEPTTHLDEENKIIILKLLRKLAKKHNRLILFSSHDWRLAKEFSDRIWYVHHQKLFSGITEDILSEFPELSNPVLFHLDEHFVPPTISAPNFQAELLYSFLQKNYSQNFSDFKFSFENNIWTIENVKFSASFIQFQELDKILQKTL